jgi:putative transposase
MLDHIHILIEIPPKYSVAQVVGYIKGKSAIQIARQYEGRQRNFTGQHFWVRVYFVSTVGLDKTVIREYIRNQENEDQRQDQLDLTAD